MGDTRIKKQNREIKEKRQKAIIQTAEAIDEEKDSELVKSISEKLCRVKMNVQMRKSLAKKLSIDEKRSLEWKIVADVFGCIDTATLAKEHPKDCARILKTVASIVGIFFPPILIIDALPTSTCAKIVEYSGTLTPEHFIHTKAKEKVEMNLIENKDDIIELDSELVEDNEN
ncbi:MAG: hypothetical protein K6B64_05500 [Acholeplasmatales bacterium]|nr:hypothetical protein [Acholeplasmatales bacterium]